MAEWVSRLESIRRQGRPVVAVTVIRCTGSTPREPGAKMLVLAESFHGTIGGGHLEQLAIEDARAMLRGSAPDSTAAKTVRYPLGAKTGQCCGGVVELLFEPLNTGPLLYVFGAGHVGQAVCRVFQGTPFTVHLIDEREEWIGAERLPSGVVRHACEWDEFARDALWDEGRTHAVVMTFRHDLDQRIIEDLSAKPLRYLGLIGSRSKAVRFRSRLLARGVSLDALAKVRCPIGLDLGGKSPQEIAVSLAAELISLHHERLLAFQSGLPTLRDAAVARLEAERVFVS